MDTTSHEHHHHKPGGFKSTTTNLAVFVVLAVAAFTLFNNFIYTQKQGDGAAVEPYRATLTGAFVCLPHKDTTGPQTDECAFGMKTDVGEYYALDFAAGSIPQNLATGVRFEASGTVTPIERLSTDQWKKYDVEGIFSVSGSVKEVQQ